LFLGALDSLSVSVPFLPIFKKISRLTIDIDSGTVKIVLYVVFFSTCSVIKRQVNQAGLLFPYKTMQIYSGFYFKRQKYAKKINFFNFAQTKL
jgi:hypothetical protein